MTVRFESVASRIMPMFRAGSQKIAVIVAIASMSMRSALSAKPMDSIFMLAASARARL